MIGMLLVGIMMFLPFHYFGHYYVEGVGYATIQAILGGQLAGAGLLALLFVGKLAATSTSLAPVLPGAFFAVALHGSDAGGAFAGLLAQIPPRASKCACLRHGGDGRHGRWRHRAAMTAVTMIFEMARDYNIVLPMILAVCASLATRRLLSRENIYTLKLIRRGHPVPRGLHAIVLVQSAKDVMETDVPICRQRCLDEFLMRPENKGAIRHVVVIRGNRISGVLRINTGIRQSLPVRKQVSRWAKSRARTSGLYKKAMHIRRHPQDVSAGRDDGLGG